MAKLFNENTYEELEKKVAKPVTPHDVEEVVETLRALNKEEAMFKYLRKTERSIHIFGLLAGEEPNERIRRIFVGHYNLMGSGSAGPDTNICEENYHVFAGILARNGYTPEKIVETIETELNRYMSWDKQFRPWNNEFRPWDKPK